MARWCEALPAADGESESAEIDGEKSMNVAAWRSGVFVRRGDVHDWIHTTFREYLAAVAVMRECKQDLNCMWDRAIARWADKDWNEVSVFALSLRVILKQM
jgi:hypothetical protein